MIKNSEEFIELALRTKSDKIFPDEVNLLYYHSVLESCVYWLNELDKIKKALYYGKKDEWFLATRSNDIQFFEEFDVDLMHGIIGAATESGEMLEILLKYFLDGKKPDLVNLKEEVFDQQWYHAIICRQIGTTFEAGQTNNIAKLRKRFPEKFSAQHAINRDLAAEREVLENGNEKG